MRKALFPRHRDLRLAGLLAPLDAPHHVKKGEWSRFREGVVLTKNAGSVKGAKSRGALVNCGLVREVRISQPVMQGVRVTVRLDETKASTRAGFLRTLTEIIGPRPANDAAGRPRP